MLAVMLKKGRDDMARRAVRSFVAQTYQNKKLLIWDNGEINEDLEAESSSVIHIPAEAYRDCTIGALRNEANSFWTEYDIAVHWDSDDWSHPDRIAEQVALLQASGKQAVGYRDMLFWHDRPCDKLGCSDPTPHGRDGSGAWLYSNNDPRYCLGTSLCYWRAAREKRPFQDISRGEDKAWLREVDSLGISSLGTSYESDRLSKETMDPRMIASIHSGNHVVYEPEQSPHNWKRVPKWDAHARKVMSL